MIPATTPSFSPRVSNGIGPELLTQSDKQLIIAATGHLGPTLDAAGFWEPNQIEGEIILDRATGSLQGPITTSYLNHLAQMEQTIRNEPEPADVQTIPQATLDKALAYLNGDETTSGFSATA